MSFATCGTCPVIMQATNLITKTQIHSHKQICSYQGDTVCSVISNPVYKKCDLFSIGSICNHCKKRRWLNLSCHIPQNINNHQLIPDVRTSANIFLPFSRSARFAAGFHLTHLWPWWHKNWMDNIIWIKVVNWWETCAPSSRWDGDHHINCFTMRSTFLMVSTVPSFQSVTHVWPIITRHTH